MSRPERKRLPAPERGRTITPSQLMRAMGNVKGNFDTIPPDCYQYAMDPAFKFSQTARRLHAWEMWRTIGSKRGGCTPHCADHRGDLNLVHAHDDLGVPYARILAAQEELEAAGLSRRDEQGRIYPAGSIPHKRRRQGEDEEKENESSLWKTICTQLISDDAFLYLQSLSESRRAQCEPDLKALWEWGERIKAEALGTAREAQQAAINEYLQHLGYSGDKERRGAPRKERTAVQLQLFELPHLSVELPLCTEFGRILNKKKNGNVQNGASLLPSHDLPHNLHESSHNRGGNVENGGSQAALADKKEAAKSTPRSNPSSSKNLPDEDLDAAGVVRTVEGLIGRRLNADNPLREKFAAAPRMLGVPASIVCKFLLQHPELRDPEDLYALINTELPVWIRHHAPQVDAARLKQESQT